MPGSERVQSEQWERPTRLRVRLWLVALALFAAGFVGKLALENTSGIAFSYPYAILLQFAFYGAGLLALFAWALRLESGGRQVSGGVVCLVALLFALAAICSGVPK